MEVTTRQGKKGSPQSSTCCPRKVLYYTNKSVEMGPSTLSVITKLHPIKSGLLVGCCRNTLTKMHGTTGPLKHSSPVLTRAPCVSIYFHSFPTGHGCVPHVSSGLRSPCLRTDRMQFHILLFNYSKEYSRVTT